MELFLGKNSCKKIWVKIRSGYVAIRKIRSYLSNKHLHILYYSMIYSHSNCCLTTWFHGNKVIANQIQKVCNKFDKMFDRHSLLQKTLKNLKRSQPPITLNFLL